LEDNGVKEFIDFCKEHGFKVEDYINPLTNSIHYTVKGQKDGEEYSYTFIITQSDILPVNVRTVCYKCIQAVISLFELPKSEFHVDGVVIRPVKYKIIACDFDGALCENKWPEIGKANREVIDYLQRQQAGGDVKLILWTCRTGDLLTNAVNWCTEQGLSFDAVNENIPENIAEFGCDSRKVFAHEYIDDRSSSRFQLPYTTEIRS
jgi:hypothetical protein